VNPELRFCPRCAGSLEWRPVEYPDVLHPVCTKCGFVLWQNRKPCVDALLVRNEGAQTEVLFGRRHDASATAQWDIPGGFLNAGDLIEPALIRACRREMDVEVSVDDLLGAFEDLYFDIPIVELIYVCRIVSGSPRAADIIDEVAWFPLDDPPPLAFASIAAAVASLQRRMKR
jgi:8-oxo-dGTP diphosphatase